MADVSLFVQCGRDQGPRFTNDKDAISNGVLGTDKDGILGCRDLLTEKQGACGELVEEEVAEFGHDVENTILCAHVHEDREIGGHIRGIGDLGDLLVLGGSLGRRG